METVKTSLVDAEIGTTYTIKELVTDDEELESFLFTLGCYVGQPVVIVSKKGNGYVISVKDSRYNIDQQLASCIRV
ncbi:ferrous iron transport protein A [Tannockella kyphosi]|uniref:ferrous iron transport protein A n=1 Tax=Tannockella kyphosi TaxID=2899121 RepID=UPI0020120397|nr:FeoA family protein [Tannockella kyphosi]